jgi:hypothetical protein
VMNECVMILTCMHLHAPGTKKPCGPSPPGICEPSPRYDAPWLGIQEMNVVNRMPAG